MAVFPELSKEPNLQSFTEEKAVNPVITSTFENGFMQTRSKFTAVPKLWTFTYNFLTDQDKDILIGFEESVCYGATFFEFTNPADLRTYEVRFVEPLKYTHEPTILSRWSVKVSLVEARPNSEITS